MWVSGRVSVRGTREVAAPAVLSVCMDTRQGTGVV